jgi:hypothetical protein
LIGWALLLRNPLTLRCLVTSLAGFGSGVALGQTRVGPGSSFAFIMGRTGLKPGDSTSMRTGSTQPRMALHLRANQGSHPGPPRMPLPAVSGSTSPGDSESEGSKTSGSGAEDSDGMTIGSDDSDPPDIRGMSLLSWGSYAGCLLVYEPSGAHSGGFRV